MSAFTREHCYNLLEKASDDSITKFFLTNVAFQRATIRSFVSQQSYLTHDKDCNRVHNIQSQSELITTFEEYFGNSSNSSIPNNEENQSNTDEIKNLNSNSHSTLQKWHITDLDFDSLSHITQYLSYNDITHIGQTCSFFQRHLTHCKTSELVLHTQDGRPLPSVRDSVYLCRFGNLQRLIIFGKHDSNWSNMSYGIKRFVDDISLYSTQLKELFIIDILKHQKQWKPKFDKNSGGHYRYYSADLIDSDSDSIEISTTDSDRDSIIFDTNNNNSKSNNNNNNNSTLTKKRGSIDENKTNTRNDDNTSDRWSSSEEEESDDYEEAQASRRRRERERDTGSHVDDESDVLLDLLSAEMNKIRKMNVIQKNNDDDRTLFGRRRRDSARFGVCSL